MRSWLALAEEATGLRVRWVRLSAGETLARLEAGRGNPQVSAWFGGPSPEYIVAAQRGLLEPFEPAVPFEIDAAARGADGAWTGFYCGYIGFICNERFLAGGGRRRAYHRCGILAHGFARIRCDACAAERVVAFSCKGRGVCPS
jgi:hypothetical protein